MKIFSGVLDLLCTGRPTDIAKLVVKVLQIVILNHPPTTPPPKNNEHLFEVDNT
jgi:hypothetical protein